MKTVQLDIAYDCELGEFLDMVKRLDLEFKVIEPIGPGGGNPLIEFTGDRRSIDILQLAFEV
jgi:hypothetical protein